MPERFFDKIKLFKGAEIQPGRPPSEAGEEDKSQPPGRRALAAPWVLLVAVALVTALFLTRFPSRSLSGLALGDVAPTDIVAPFDLVIEDAEETALRRTAAADAVLPVYTFDLNVFANTEESIRRLFAEGRAWSVLYPGGGRADDLRARLVEKVGVDLETADVAALARLKFPADLEEALIGLLTKISAQGIVVAKTLFIHGESERGLTLVDGRGGERNVRAGDLLDIRESEALFAADLAKIELSERGRALVSGLGQIFLTSNVTYNKIETDRRKAAAREAVPPVTLTVKKDRIIVRKGDEVTADSLKVLDRYNERIRKRANVLPHLAGIFLLYALLLFALWTFLNDSRKAREAERQFRMTCVSLVASLVLYEAFIVLTGAVSGSFSAPAFARVETYYLAFPFQAAVLIFAFLVDAPMTLLYIVLNSLTVGILLGADFFLTAFCFLGGLAAGYGVKLYKRRYRAATLRAGFTLLPAANVFTVIVFSLILRRADLAALPAEVALGLLGGAFSAVLAYSLLSVVESAFGFVTGSKLLELTNSDLPIFRQMSEEAPGSYHHSLVVATLAEKAAEELGLDAPLAKAGALYHDIGKTKMPEYFIENRTREFDLHKDLTPSMSTLVIKNHVKEGAELARKLRLPRPLREIIEQHHGNSLVRFFYAKAKQLYDPMEQVVGEESFRYPGPPPQTKEAGLVMLADAIEAASRSLKSPTKDNLKRVITDIINGALQDGQLDACDFSMRELRIVAAAFLTILYAIYHPRIEYPGFGFDGRPPHKNGTNGAKKKDHDRDHQPPEKKPDPD
jgi:putative nucleotidyltransferase with HDIG domain